MGDVGYIQTADGSFSVLFNAYEPSKSSKGLFIDIVPLSVNGGSTVKSRKHGDARLTKGLKSIFTIGKKDLWVPLISSSNIDQSTLISIHRVKATYSVPLRHGEESARLFTESSVFRYMKNPPRAERWLNVNVNKILLIGNQKGLEKKQRSDILLGI